MQQTLSQQEQVNNPFSGSTKGMFENISQPSQQQVPMDKDMKDFEKNFMGMFQNLAS
jgi:hypothetical protein